MSETAPLLPSSVRNNLPSRSQVERAIPSESQRIQLSQSVGALKAGKLPSQDQISQIIDFVVSSDVLKATGGPSSRTARLGEEGSRVLEDLKNVLRAVKKWGEEKNGDDLLQNILYSTATADLDVSIGTFPTSPLCPSFPVKNSPLFLLSRLFPALFFVHRRPLHFRPQDRTRPRLLQSHSTILHPRLPAHHLPGFPIPR